jgi:hypothetical protein
MVSEMEDEDGLIFPTLSEFIILFEIKMNIPGTSYTIMYPPFLDIFGAACI